MQHYKLFTFLIESKLYIWRPNQVAIYPIVTVDSFYSNVLTQIVSFRQQHSTLPNIPKAKMNSILNFINKQSAISLNVENFNITKPVFNLFASQCITSVSHAHMQPYK